MGQSDTGVSKVSAHDFDLLHYRLPLRGNFDVEMDATIGTYNTGMMFAGEFDAFKDAKRADHGTPLTHTTLDLNPPLSKVRHQARLRLRVRDGVCTAFINGLKISSRQLPANHDPWLAIYSRGRHLSRISNVEITGNPFIPESVSLVTDEVLSGWIPYFGTGIGTPESGFHWSPPSPGDDGPAIGIFGKRHPVPRGSFQERLLQYYRPVIGNESVEYEFLYEPDTTLAHAAVDQLAFLLTADGIVEHEVTDGRFGGIDAEPGNRVTRPDFRRGPSTLPLLVSEWNRMQLKFDDDSVQLILNDELVYARPLGPAGPRTFGLFHYSDQTEANVRNVVLSGDWPRSVPARMQQELATNIALTLDADRPRLTTVFQHDFAQLGIERDYFQVTPGDARIAQTPNGFLAQVNRPGRWMHAEVHTRLALRGDFDIETSFDDLRATGPDQGAVSLVVHFDDEQKYYAPIVRMKNEAQHQLVHAGVSFMEDGTQTYLNATGDGIESEATSGRLRLSRRGSTLWYLFAEGTSDSYRVLGQTTVPTADTELSNSIQLRAMALDQGSATVVIRDVTMRAEKMFRIDEKTARGLAVMNPDGTGFKEVADVPDGMQFIGSPEWAPDNETLAFDASNGGTETSHIYTVKIDGTGLYDLGNGCMPGFSADGKRVVFTQPGFGIGTMNRDGSGREVVERNGWSGQWSPDGRYICWGRGGNIVVMNVETKERTKLLVGGQATMFNWTHWNPAWSHDSRWICFKGRNRQTGGEDIVVVAIDSDDFKVILPSSEGVHVDFGWHPDNKRVLVGMQTPGTPRTMLYLLDRTVDAPPQPLPNLPEDWNIVNFAWSRDGKRIAFTGDRDPRKVEWTGRPVEAAAEEK